MSPKSLLFIIAKLAIVYYFNMVRNVLKLLVNYEVLGASAARGPEAFGQVLDGASRKREWV